MRSGRQPIDPSEVVIGPVTAARHDVDIGDAVTVVHPSGGSDGSSVTVVGIGLFPEIDEGDFTDAIGLLGPAFEELAASPDLFEASQVVVRLAPNAQVDPVIERLRARFPESLSAPLPARPGDVGSLSTVRSMPGWLLAFGAVLGTASLAHVLRTTTTRRADDLRTLRVLGMTRRQIRWCFVTQALTLAAIALAIGVPVGLAAGRLAWRTVAASLDVATDPKVPLTAILLVAVLTAAVASLAAAGQRAAGDAARPARS